MRLGAAFVPVRKKGKLPGDVKVVSYEKEYGVVSPFAPCIIILVYGADSRIPDQQDEFEMHSDAIKPGQTCIVVEYVLHLLAVILPELNLSNHTHSDLIATGGSAAGAGQLISLLGGKTVEYLFVVGLPFLKVSIPAACSSTNLSDVRWLTWSLYVQGHEKLDAPSYSMIEAED
jgi:adenine phosphoribosyltransferase